MAISDEQGRLATCAAIHEKVDALLGEPKVCGVPSNLKALADTMKSLMEISRVHGGGADRLGEGELLELLLTGRLGSEDGTYATD